MWTKLTNYVNNLVDKLALIHTKSSKTNMLYPLLTSTKSYKTCFNLKKRSYQSSIYEKIINFAYY